MDKGSCPKVLTKEHWPRFDFDGRWMDSDWMDSHLAAFGLCPQFCFPNRISHNLHLSPARLKSDFFLICAFVHFFGENLYYPNLVVGVHHGANFWLDVLQVWESTLPQDNLVHRNCKDCVTKKVDFLLGSNLVWLFRKMRARVNLRKWKCPLAPTDSEGGVWLIKTGWTIILQYHWIIFEIRKKV